MSTTALRLRTLRPLLAPLPYTPHRASSTKPAKHTVLEQPTKFVPPSHGSRRRGAWTMPRIYGRRWTGDDKENTRWYPGLMAPKGSWEHWFWHSRAVHMWVTMGTLVSLAISTFILNFQTSSPFRHELPESSLFWSDPVAYVSLWRRAIRLHNEDRTRRVAEAHNRRSEDAMRRREYMRAHGLETDGVLGKLVKREEEGGAK